MDRGVCLVVGAGEGGGAGIARAFAKEGYTVCITRRPRNFAQLESQAQAIRDSGGNWPMKKKEWSISRESLTPSHFYIGSHRGPGRLKLTFAPRKKKW